jgi:hypothetical protein
MMFCSGGPAGGRLPHQDAPIGHKAQIKPAALQQVGANELGLRRDGLVHSLGPAEGMRRRKRAKFEAAAGSVADGLGRPRTGGMVAVKTHGEVGFQ